MPLTTPDNPLSDPTPAPAAPEPTPEPAVVAAPPPAKPAKAAKVSPPALARASSSGSAEVHGLLARREIAASNGDAAALAAADAALAALGFTV
jgi:hypothetical protein